jgi:tetratricopeptide (TPR) repeat protein/predicted Ser/Thr protein kinase
MLASGDEAHDRTLAVSPGPGDGVAELETLVGSSDAPSRATSSREHEPKSLGDAAGRATLLPGDPRRVGRFAVLSRLGAGGMGVVFSAYDEELDRRVAIKLLRTGEGSRSDTLGRTRLLREAQAMARINHPNVIAVYDVGTQGGGVFVAMEFVRGRTLGGWARAEVRPWRVILDTYAQAARGLAAAHAMGLTHRDFKPDNAMIGEDGRVRVLDFGLARSASDTAELAATRGASDPAAPDAAPEHERISQRLTMTGAIMGTPAYMPPEQWHGSAVDARSDQYSWCVAVWEALYGERPHRGETLGALCKAVLAGEIAAPDRRDVPRFVEVALRRGLSVAPADRFPSMEALLRVIEDDPRVRARRLGGGVLGFAAAVVAAAAWWFAPRPTEEAPCSSAPLRVQAVFDDRSRAAITRSFVETGIGFAPRAAAGALAEIDEYGGKWATMHREVCLAHRAGEVSDELLDLRMQCLDRRLGEVAAVVATLIAADEETVARAANVVSSIGALETCADVAALRAHTPLPEAPETRRTIASLRAELARVRAEREAGHWAQALELAKPLHDRASAIEWAPIQAEAKYRLADALDWSGDSAAALPLYEAAAHGALATGDDALFIDAAAQLVWAYGEVQLEAEPALAWAELAEAVLQRIGGNDTLEGMLANAEGATLMRAGRYDEATAQYARSLAATSRAFGEHHPIITRSHVNLGNIHRQHGEYDAALVAYRRAQEIAREGYGADHPQTLRIDGLVLTVLADLGEWERSIEEGRALLEIQRAALGDHPDVVITSIHVANALRKGQRHEDALVVLNDANAVLGRMPPETFPDQRISVASNIARVLATLGRHEEARTAIAAALEYAITVYGETHAEVGVIWVMAGEIHLVGDRVDEARAAFERGRDMAIATQSPNHPYVATAEDQLGILASLRGDRPQALAHHRRALEILDASDGDARTKQEVLLHIATWHLDEGDLDDAEVAIQRALTLDHDDVSTAAEALFLAARISWARGRHAFAREQADAAHLRLSTLRETSPTARAELQAIDTWLAEHPVP